ncbi:helix-turn-helix domain-containing protein [Fulvivirgaceae bacterium BMA10]|uniref:Helix-turn-helix domain-containing protein n=1 Tax=Splendidivirga corallicola TaxID=3051826 RepID=A0ABT8KPT3_9BACT|nr:helix-turn-helix domain-containing protein [Fulvivirgaceae bacterium BMA10]
MDSEEIYFNLNPVNFFIISGLFQNFILTGILLFRRGDRPLANRLISLTLLIVNLHLTYLMVLDTNLDNFFPSLLWIPYSYITAIGPLIYFYAKALTNTGFVLSRVSIRHFVPVIVEFILQLIQIAYSIQDAQLYYNTPLYFYVTPITYLWAAGSILFYLHLSLKIINNHEVWVLENFSNLKEITLNWLKKLIVYYRLLWIIWVPFIITFLLFFRFQLQYISIVLALYFLMLILTYLTLWIGLESLKKGNLIFLKPNEEKTANKNFGKLTKAEIQNCISKIIRLMDQDKMYLNENLSLRELAIKLNADPNLISFVLNNHMEKNFYDFVNSYRIEEVINKLNDPSYKHLTLLGIAMESGFNSKTTFNRVFKQVTGMTPSAFQKRSTN